MVIDRTRDQRLEALAVGNEIRMYRAQLRRQVAAGEIRTADLIENPPTGLETCRVERVLDWTPRFGDIKVARLLRLVRISPHKTVGGLSDRQRADLVARLERMS